MTVEEAPLIRLTATLNGEMEPVHATLNAVGGRVFSINLNRPLPLKGKVIVSHVKHAWLSNFPAKKS
jgi:hypothetical protein